MAFNIEPLEQRPPQACGDAAERREGTFNATLAEAARGFAQAMIDGDLAALKRICRGAATGYPPAFVLNRGHAAYANQRLSDLTFEVFEDENRVCIRSPDGGLHEDLKFKCSSDGYYFVYYNR